MLDIIIALAVLVFGTVLIFLLGSSGRIESLQALRPFTLLAFLRSVGAFYAGVDAKSIFYPLVLFGLLLGGAQSIFSIIWVTASRNHAQLVYVPGHLVTMATYVLLFGCHCARRRARRCWRTTTSP